MNRRHHAQQGTALIVLMLILLISAGYYLFSVASALGGQGKRDQNTAAALARAKEGLIAYAATQEFQKATPSLTKIGLLPLPDMGPDKGSGGPEGTATAIFAGNSTGLSVAGKFPWRTLEIPPIRDGYSECLWYIVSGRFKNNPTTKPFNWDTVGQIDLIDERGTIIVANAAALVIAPGPRLDGQDRHFLHPDFAECGGNYDVRNYLDPIDNAHATLGVTHYLQGDNHHIADGTDNKSFIQINNDDYNDRILSITVDEIFATIIKLNEFRIQIDNWLDDPIFQAILLNVPISANAHGTANLGTSCSSIAPSNQEFCENWQDMLFLTELPTPSSIMIDGANTALCRRVLIFSGKRNTTQIRVTATDKNSPANYLEGQNLTAFALPIATSSNFSGTAHFDPTNPGADIMRCLP